MNKQLLLIILITLIVPPLLWIVHIYTKPMPKVTEIDMVAGPPLEYSQTRIAHKEFIRSQNYQLASSDEDVVTLLKKKPNPLYKSDDVVIRYDNEQNLFVAEITTFLIEPAKREAITWFINQGVSLEAICTLPVTFTIDKHSTDTLRGLGIRFDPLPTECK